ncbi:GAF domain-containing protein [Zavarzinia compransoris]|uniref:Transcriptional regulator n=1 Tax=Zavarzinia compransoris TaxID=1264899 RepID=A0A317DWP3_9PROT|nr:GAF domain-containing protein [Zavarzinia compransoris]PWR18852.1 transcriptional regulator [Zavarzinia compransoris]TDP48845.1 adenylate cyclase [Zavarzinia compransoris]
MTRLRDIRGCFEGVIPSIIATVDGEGMPNISYLSHVYYLDDDHVALSNQYFTKTAANTRTRGHAALILVDGISGRQYQLDITFLRAEAAGELFTRMAAHLKAMSSQQGMAEIMALRSADIYRVTSCIPVPCPDLEGETGPPAAPALDRLGAAARLAAVLGAAPEADSMIDLALEGLDRVFGFRQAMILVPDADGRRLTTLASRGYDSLGIGSEVPAGQGVIGIAADSRLPLRISDMSRGRRYAAAVGGALPVAPRSIPLPGLPEALSQMAVPMIHRGQMLGVLFVESPARFAFLQEDEDALALLAGQLAAGLRLHEAEARDAPGLAPAGTMEPPAPARRIRLRYYRYDDSVFIDEGYLIKGVPGRLLYHLIAIFLREGRQEFTNREIRLAPELRLPEVKDNLETRLILLRRRLEEHQAPLRLIRTGRGRLRLELDGQPTIDVVEDA